jgi:small GTP-binding protein
MAKPKHTNTPCEPLPDLLNYDPEPADGVRVGESPVPGLTLRRILRGHTDAITRIAWSPDGRLLASPSDDKTTRIWDVARGECVAVLKAHKGEVCSVTWSPDGSRLASGSSDETIRIWNTETWENLTMLRGHNSLVRCVTWSPDGQLLASGGNSDLIIWLTEKWQKHIQLSIHTQLFSFVDWSSDSKRLFVGYVNSRLLEVWCAISRRKLHTLNLPSRHVYEISQKPNTSIIAIANGPTIVLLDDDLYEVGSVIEGHTAELISVAFSSTGQILATKSFDNTVRLWNSDSWQEIAELNEITINTFGKSLAFHPQLSVLATLGEKDTVIRIWDIDIDVLLGQTPTDSVRYTTAKLVLVGDSGVGKTGLGWRLAHGKFKEHASTHGQQFWVVDDLCTARKDGTQCEAVLWDLAGQHVYRPIHSIFLDNVDASLVLFDPSNRQDPLKGVQFWLGQLKGKGQLPPSVLVGARVDRGAPAVSQDYLVQFCQRYGISGGYVSTSAKSGEGLEALIELLKDQIPWEAMTTTVTTVTFKRIKDYVLALKEKSDRQGVLVRPTELRKQLASEWQERPFDFAQGDEKQVEWVFTDAEMMTAVGHLETHGYVTILKSSSGETHILLTPELLVDLASSIVLLADKHPRELGAISETELLQGRYPFEELAGLDEAERYILLDAAVLRFLEHNVCFRETFGSDTLLIFPGLIKQKRPLVDEFPATDDVSYVVRGRVENLYAMLVVLLGYTPSFTRINQWQNQAQYEMGQGEICGFRLIEDREGEIELVLYYSEHMPPRGRASFQELFERFLYQREVEVTRFPPVACLEGHRLERATVVSRIREGKTFAFCAECGGRVDLPNLDKSGIGTGASDWLQREEAAARLRSTYEVYLSNVKSYRRGRATPRCYLSRAPGEENCAADLIHYLQDAGVYIIEEAAQVQPDDYVVVLDTLAYQRLWRNPTPAFETDANLVKARLGGDKSHLISIKLEGKAGSTTSHDLDNCTPGDFCDTTHYPVSLFNLVLNLYAIPLTHAGFAPLRESLHQQWEERLGRLPAQETSTKNSLRIFISYAHKDEAFKDELVDMLASMQRRGIINAWQDRRIEAGDEWYHAIQEAMNECDLALLLVSKNFLASRFIQDEEVPRLLQRRKEEGMRVIPIIIRPCIWSSEPILKDLQALPQDGKAVITFPEKTGERDQVWMEIAKEIERRAKALQSDV